jgi:hypothetical protein
MLVPKVVGAAVYAACMAKFSGLFTAEGVVNPEAVKSWDRQSQIAQVIAEVIVAQILATGQVAPGIVTAGSPATQTSTTPGKII